MARKWIGYIGVGSLMCAALGCGILYTRQARLQQAISDKVLRFHVLANSDSEADQNLKLAVRDAVGSFMQEKLTAVENLEECGNSSRFRDMWTSRRLSLYIYVMKYHCL